MIALLCLLLVQDTAEATFKKIEDALKKADTIKVVMSGAAEMASQGMSMKASFDGTLLLKGADKIRVTMKVKEGEEEPVEMGVVASDGKMNGSASAAGPTPANLRDDLVTLLPRLGAAVAMQAALDAGAGRKKELKAEISNLASKGVANGVGTLTFDVAFDGVAWKTTLGYDEKTHRLLTLATRVVPKDP